MTLLLTIGGAAVWLLYRLGTRYIDRADQRFEHQAQRQMRLEGKVDESLHRLYMANADEPEKDGK